jgi:competence protein ComEC
MTGIALYTVLVGADASVVRAAIMGGVYLFGSLVLGRSTYHYASLFLAGVFMTLVHPFALWDIGFQLSFAATLGLMRYAGPMQNWTRGWLAARLSPEQTHRLMGWISEGILLTLAAQIPTLPLLVFYFEQLSLVSLLANPLILPAQPYVMIMGGLATLAGVVFPAAGQILAWAAWLGLAYTIQMVEWLAQVPFAAVPVTLEWPGLLLVYGLIAAITYYIELSPDRRSEVRQWAGGKVGWSSFLGAGAVMTLLVVAWGRGQPDGQLHIHFLNVDRGQGLLVQTPAGRHILIDGGASGQQLNVMLGRRLPFWKRTIDVAVAREEPLQGLSAVLARRPAGQLLHGPVIDLMTIPPEAAEGSQPLVGGQRLHMGDGVILEVVASESGEPWLRLEHGNLAVWLPDDGEALVLPAGVQPGDTVPLAMVLWGSSVAEKEGAHGNVIALETLGNVEMVTDGREMVLQTWGNR